MDTERTLAAIQRELLSCPDDWVASKFAPGEINDLSMCEEIIYGRQEISWQLAVDLMTGDRSMPEDLDNQHTREIIRLLSLKEDE